MENRTEIKPKIDETWLRVLGEEFSKPYFTTLKQFLVEEKSRATVYPPGPLIFNAFNTSPFDKVKVVLLGQDPYHGKGQAEGLSFSVPMGIKPPPSLINMYKELHEDTGFVIPNHGHLIKWSEQGVLLLNSVLTVRASEAGSHRGKGWEQFTDQVIRVLSEKRENLVFLLWGKYAQDKSGLIDTGKHLVLKAAHPSPYSASAGFFGCRHFSKTNDYLIEKGITPVDWQL